MSAIKKLCFVVLAVIVIWSSVALVTARDRNYIISPVSGHVTVNGKAVADADIRVEGFGQKDMADASGFYRLYPRSGLTGSVTAYYKDYKVSSARLTTPATPPYLVVDLDIRIPSPTPKSTPSPVPTATSGPSPTPQLTPTPAQVSAPAAYIVPFDYSLLPAWNYMATPSPEPLLAEANLTNETEGLLASNATPAVVTAEPDPLPAQPVGAQKKNDIYNLIFPAILLLNVVCAAGAIGLWYLLEKK